MDRKQIVKNQFNDQAEKFSDWSVTKNIDYMQRYFEFCGMTPEDDLLDVACGSGEFSIFCARKIRSVCGVDISDRMIELAKDQAIAGKLKNIHFECNDVENIPSEDNAFSMVFCKSAFHHLSNYDNVFNEMIRCCSGGGRISTQDIVSYEDEKVNDFFEKIEKEIDKSHNKALSKKQFTELFLQNEIGILNSWEVEIELNVNEYTNHAIQSETNLENIGQLLDYGRNDKDISQYFTTIDDELFFKRNVFLVLGKK